MRFRSGFQSERGTVMVEAAVGALIFLTIIFAILSLSILGFNRLVVTYALVNTGRYAALVSGPSREAQIGNYFQTQLDDLGLGMPSAVLTMCPAENTCTSNDAGGGGQTIVLRARTELRFGRIMPPVYINDSLAVRNENF